MDEYRWIYQLFFSALVLAGYSALFHLTQRAVRSWGERHRNQLQRINQVVIYFKVILLVVLLVVLALIWGFDYRGFWVVASSVLAVMGVVLFAQWSILSNVTSGVIVFFTFPARVGDEIEIIDGVNSVRGKLEDIGLFQIRITDKENNTLVYPNNLLLQKPVKRWQHEPAKKTERLRWQGRSER